MTTEHLKEIKTSLPRGGQRRLASIMCCHPNKIADGFAGFVKNEKFMTRLIAEAKKITQTKSA